MSFLSSLVKRWSMNAHDHAIKAIVSLDPESASEAEIDERMGQLDLVSQQYASSRRDAERERAEADAVEKQYNEKLAAAEILQKRLEDPSLSEDAKAKLETSISNLLTDLDKLSVDLEREKKEADEAETFADSIKVELEQLGESLKSARQQLKEAKRSMEVAEKQEEQAKRKAEQATAIAGIRNRGEKLNSALLAMQEKAEEHRKAAAAATAKASVLKPAADSTVDPVIADALREARGQEDKSKLSTADRLAELKKKASVTA